MGGRVMSIDPNACVSDHMESQPYEITCSKCGSILNITERNVDKDFDLHIEVEPCPCGGEE